MVPDDQTLQRTAEAMGLWSGGFTLIIAMTLGIAATCALAAVTATVTGKGFPFCNDPRRE